MGEEKLDNAVYTIRGYADLADMARARGDRHDRGSGPPSRPRKMHRRSSRTTWWYGGDAESYADSLDDPGNKKVFQRHWIGLTPTDAVLPKLPGRRSARWRPAAHANATLDQHERALLHRRTRAVPHRHRTDLGAGRQPRRQLRLGGVRSAQRA